MKRQLTLALVALGLTPVLSAGTYFSQPGGVSSETLLSRRSIQPGAVYQVRLQVPWGRAEEYLREYAAWYLPIDQFECTGIRESLKSKCESSGRKLITTLTREHGDQFNLIFLYRYESAYKEHYYCKYPKAFLLYHASLSKLEDDTIFKVALDKWAKAEKSRYKTWALEDALRALPEDCTVDLKEEQQAAVDFARDVVHEFDLKLFEKIVADEGSWYFDVDMCSLSPRADCTDKGRPWLGRAFKAGWGTEGGKPVVPPAGSPVSTPR